VAKQAAEKVFRCHPERSHRGLAPRRCEGSASSQSSGKKRIPRAKSPFGM